MEAWSVDRKDVAVGRPVSARHLAHRNGIYGNAKINKLSSGPGANSPKRILVMSGQPVFAVSLAGV